MPFTRTLRYLSLPAAIALGTALAVACSAGVPTSPDQALGPSFKKKSGSGGQPSMKDDSGSGSCNSSYNRISVELWPAFQSFDKNGNGYVCQLIV